MSSSETGSQVTAYSCRQCGAVVLDDRDRQCCGEGMDPIAVDAVNEPDLTTLLSLVFGVSPTGIDVFVHVLEEEPVTTDDIATALGVNRSTVSRQLNHLTELGVIERRERSLKEGGRVHEYTPVSLEAVRQRHREGLLSWVNDAIALINGVNRRKLAAASERARKEDSP
jgi:predicted transcriptional regulator